MPYAQKIRDATFTGPKTLGNLLGRWAINLDFPVAELSQITGATRQTVYNWFGGGAVTPAYQERVEMLIRTLSSVKTLDEARKKLSKR